MQRLAALKESTERIEEAVQAVRSEIGRVERETEWDGLATPADRGTQRTHELGREMAQSDISENGALTHLFTLRQLEIALSLISELSGHLSELSERLEKIEAGRAH
jgi:hypothetical protein